MVRLADLHQNGRNLLRIKGEIHSQKASPNLGQGTWLKSLATQPLVSQIGELGAIETWRSQYRNSGFPNKKFDQMMALESLQEWKEEELSQSERSLEISVAFDDLPASKRRQYEERLGREKGESPEWHECFVRLYTGAEWTFEKWATEAGLDCLDLNSINLYDPQDYRVGGRKVDVKTTISIGRPEIKTYWSPDGFSKSGEIICAVTSKLKSRDERICRHRIQGIFHSPLYEGVRMPLNYFKLDKNLLNACYFHPPDIFFGVGKPPAPNLPFIDADVIDYCAENRVNLAALFHLRTIDAIQIVRRALSSSLQDFIPLVAELEECGLRYLLPHYLADYILGKIVSKDHQIDTEAIENVLWSLFEPSLDQRRYLESLIRACVVLPDVHCAQHPDESIWDMDIDVLPGRKLILRARCRVNPRWGTTFFAYSWKTLQTLVYGGPGVSVCDAPGCGCLTHLYDGKRIGRKDCSKYGAPREQYSGKGPAGLSASAEI